MFGTSTNFKNKLNQGSDRQPLLDRILAPICLIVLFLIPNLLWVLIDRRVWPWDQAWYGEVSTDLYYLLTHSPGAWYNGLIALMPSKPPLLTWLGEFIVPLGVAAGSVDVALLMFIVLQQAVTLGLVWAASRIISPNNTWAAASAVLLVASGPLFTGISHQYLVEPLQVLDTAASLVVVLMARRLSALRLLAFLALVVVAGMGIKTTTLIYAGLFWLISFWVLIRKTYAGDLRLRDPLAWVILVATGVLGAVTLHWYYANMLDVLLHVQSATGADAELYGHRDALFKKLAFWWYVAGISFFLWPPAVVVLVVVLFCAAPLRIMTIKSFDDSRIDIVIIAAAAAHVMITGLVLASQPNEENRFIASLVPNVAILLSWAIGASGFRLVGACISTLLGVQLVLVNAQSFGYTIQAATSAWLLPLNVDRTDRRTMHDVLLQTCPIEDAGRINVIGPEFPQMNANSMSFFSAKERLRSDYRCSYTSMGYAETDIEKALKRIKDMKVEFVVLPRPEFLPKQLDPFNKVLGSAEERILKSPAFESVGTSGPYQIFKSKDGR